MHKLFMRKLCILFILGSVYLPLHAQDTDSAKTAPVAKILKIKREHYPNPAGKGMMTPTAWGSTRPFIFGFFGGTFPQVYTTKPDMVAAGGIGFGNSYKAISVVAIFNVFDVSKASIYGGDLIVSRDIGMGTTMSVGALNLVHSNKDDGGSSYYFCISHASQTIKSKTPGFSGLSYTIGAGTGRFYDKSYKDSLTGKGEHGTAVFANLSYEFIKGVNIIAEWSGLNLGFALGIRPSFKFPAINIGVTDLTRNSGDKPRLLLSLGQAFLLSKK